MGFFSQEEANCVFSHALLKRASRVALCTCFSGYFEGNSQCGMKPRALAIYCTYRHSNSFMSSATYTSLSLSPLAWMMVSMPFPRSMSPTRRQQASEFLIPQVYSRRKITRYSFHIRHAVPRVVPGSVPSSEEKKASSSKGLRKWGILISFFTLSTGIYAFIPMEFI